MRTEDGLAEQAKAMTGSEDSAAAILQCPMTRAPLARMAAEPLAECNRLQAAGRLFHVDGTPVPRPLEEALRTPDGALAYRREEGIHWLLPSLAIRLRDDFPAPPETWRAEKQRVRDFYEQIGWRKEGEVFEDTRRFEDLRPVAAEYLHRCHLRAGRWLRPRGEYFLDAASGPLAFSEPIAYSEGYRFRICVDFSLAALRAARGKLGDRGLYLLGDVTNLPLRDGCCDGAVSLHTLFHVPADQQVQAFREFQRVLRPGAAGVVVYSWGPHCWAMRLALAPFKLCKRPEQWLRRLVKRLRGKSAAPSAPGLYFHAHRRRWFREQLGDLELEFAVWRSLSVPFMRKFIRPWLFGRMLLRAAFHLEERFPRAAARWGFYPLIVVRGTTRSRDA
jgi:ubiquinone/menaquinone biosynthesis C-methylase UbiE/uncharacterized protein YbaR (Trm112 family)